jgi:hypothetical protein
MSPEAPPDITVKASLHHQEAGGTSSERLHVPSENLIHPSLLSDPLNTFLASDIKFPVPSFREIGLRTEAQFDTMRDAFERLSGFIRQDEGS